MEPTLSWTLFELSEIIGGELHGPAELRISKPVPAGDGSPDGITFAESSKYLALAESTTVGAILVGLGDESADKPYIQCRSPREAFGRILAMAWRELPLADGVHDTAVISGSATIEKGARVGAYVVIEADVYVNATSRIYPFCYVGENCYLSNGVKLYPHVCLYRDIWLGERTTVHSGAVIGADGFGYFWDGARHRKVPQAGTVRIDDDCEVGANTTIDRATAGNTHIEKGTKIDNLVQIAHNVVIGADSVIASQVGIAGSTRIGARNIFAGQSGAIDHVETADDAVFAARAGVRQNVDSPGTYFGSEVARPLEEGMRIQAALSKLPGLLQRVRKLEAEIEKLKGGS